MKERPMHTSRYLGGLLLFLLVVYWPLTATVFTLKNDALTYFLPWRRAISEAVQGGHFPFWSPYLYTGLPLHADIQSGAWNPVVLLLSCFTTYNMSVLQWETLLYILLGGVGFFKLGRRFGWSAPTCLLLGAAYGCQGFLIDSGAFVPWVCSAGWIPFVLLYFKQLHEDLRWSNALKLGGSLFLLFSAGYPSFFLLAAYLLLGLTICTLVRDLQGRTGATGRRLILLGGSAGVFFLLSLPALYSYVQFFPFYQRGGGASLAQVQFNPFHVRNLLSLLFPPASYKLDTPNDPTSRNLFIGLVPLLFVLWSFRNRWRPVQWTIAGITLLFFLFSLGPATPVRGLLYHALPLLDSFRHPATARLFVAMGLLLLSGYGLEAYAQDSVEKKRIFFRLALLFLGGSLLAVLVSKGIPGLQLVREGGLSVAGFKNVLDRSSATDWLLLAGCVQVLTILLCLFRAKSTGTNIRVGLLNLLLCAWLSFPFTLLSQHRTSTVNAWLHTFPRGFPLSLAARQIEAVPEDSSQVTVFGYRPFYAKVISLQNHVVTPTLTDTYNRFLTTPGWMDSVTGGWLGQLKSGGGSVALTKFGPNEMELQVQAIQADTLLFRQQYHPHWTAAVNGQPMQVRRSELTFMQAAVPAGTSLVRFRYRPPGLTTLALVSWTLGVLGLLLICYHKWLRP